jgi:PhnB protein
LIVRGAGEAIEFYKKAFGAVEVYRLGEPGGPVMHAEIRIGTSPIMLADEFPDRQAFGPMTLGGTPINLLLYVEDVDAIMARALAAGGTLTDPVKNQFYGDRIGGMTDPFGHCWYLATRIEDVPPDEMERRFLAAVQAHRGQQ